MSKKLILTPNAYKAGKVYAVKPINGTGDFDFVRNTGRTRINVNGNIEALSNNIVALDYQNGCPEILLEPQRTNLFEYSEDFADNYWDKNNASIISDVEISPAGDNTADKLVEDSNNTFHRIKIINNLSVNNKFTYSIFAKSSDRGFLIFRSDIEGSNLQVVFDTAVGTIVFNGFNGTSKIENYGNGWFRCSLTVINNNNSPTFSFLLSDNVVNSNDLPIYQGDASSGLLLWGAMLEKGELTSYIPTNGSITTRNKDILSKDLTSIIQPTYTAFLEVVGDEGRLKIEDNDTGIDLPLNGSGKIAIQVDSQIKIIFPDNGQPQTELIFSKNSDFKDLTFTSDDAATRLGVVAFEDNIQDVSNWVSGSITSSLLI